MRRRGEALIASGVDATCPLCGGRGPFAGGERHAEFAMVRCPDCDLQFSAPMREAGRRFYETDDLYAGPEALYTSPRFLGWDQNRFLVDRPHRGGRLLDVGCGAGAFLEAARAAGYRVAGVDLSRVQLELARQRFGLSDVHATTFADYARGQAAGTFDVVTAFQVLEHAADPRRFLGDARRLLRSGGAIAIGVPNSRMWRMFRHPLDTPPNHLTRWSRRSLTRAMDTAGFEVTRVDEHRSVYGVLLRTVRLGVLRRLMARTARAGADAAPNRAVLELSIAKARLLTALDVPARVLLTIARAPGVLLYALGRAR